MAPRRLAPVEVQPKSFAFSAANLEWAEAELTKYPQGRQESAILALLWRAMCEFFVAVFRISDDLHALRRSQNID